MIYLGLDLGSKTLGISIGDRSETIASPLEVIRYNNYDELLYKLEDIVLSRKVEAFVLGIPKNLNGSISTREIETIQFKEILEKKFNKLVEVQDERFSTIEANNLLISNGTRRENRKQVIDKLASAIILQSFLDRRKNEKQHISNEG